MKKILIALCCLIALPIIPLLVAVDNVLEWFFKPRFFEDLIKGMRDDQ